MFVFRKCQLPFAFAFFPTPQWHNRLTKSLLFLLESSDYMHVRAALLCSELTCCFRCRFAAALPVNCRITYWLFIPSLLSSPPPLILS